MTTKSPSRKGSATRDNTNHSSFRGLAPINTPTKDDSQPKHNEDDRGERISNPNIYVVQPFKQRSLPKDLIQRKKNAPNPGEELLNNTIELINHFTVCYESVKEQLEYQQNNPNPNENVNEGKSMVIGRKSPSKQINHHQQRIAKQARLRPLIVHEDQQNHSQTFLGDFNGISSKRERSDTDLSEVYNGKLRLLRKLKPEYFDLQGNLLSLKQQQQTLSINQSSTNKSTTTSSDQRSNEKFSQINQNNHQIFLTEVAKGKDKEDDEYISMMVNGPRNSVDEKGSDENSSIVRIIDIKTRTNPK